jgi:hypothetical protein
MEFLLTEQKNIWGTTVIDMSKDEHNRKHAYAKALFLTLYQQKQFISHIRQNKCSTCKKNYFAKNP